MRNEEKARQLKDQFGVTAVVGSYADTDKLTELAAAADVVFATVRFDLRRKRSVADCRAPFCKADCDDLPAAKAILAGLKRRYQQTGSPAALVHTVSRRKQHRGCQS